MVPQIEGRIIGLVCSRIWCWGRYLDLGSSKRDMGQTI